MRDSSMFVARKSKELLARIIYLSYLNANEDAVLSQLNLHLKDILAESLNLNIELSDCRKIKNCSLEIHQILVDLVFHSHAGDDFNFDKHVNKKDNTFLTSFWQDI